MHVGAYYLLCVVCWLMHVALLLIICRELHIYIYIYVFLFVISLYIYIYIERDRERERDRQREIYSYVCVYCFIICRKFSAINVYVYLFVCLYLLCLYSAIIVLCVSCLYLLCIVYQLPPLGRLLHCGQAALDRLDDLNNIYERERYNIQ